MEKSVEAQRERERIRDRDQATAHRPAGEMVPVLETASGKVKHVHGIDAREQVLQGTAEMISSIVIPHDRLNDRGLVEVFDVPSQRRKWVHPIDAKEMIALDTATLDLAGRPPTSPAPGPTTIPSDGVPGGQV